jgi:acyl-CoA synthetase (AMP-forming)/AMP-acid ligase II
MNSLVQVLQARASTQGGDTALIFLEDGDHQEVHLTYAQLDQRARATAALLQGLAEPGERAVLLYPPGLDFVVALFGCLYAGVTAVPAYPANPRRVDRHLGRLKAILKDSGATLALTLSALQGHGQLALADADFASLQWVCTDAIPAGAEHGFAQLAPPPMAFLQYTSGSTSLPRGVMLTHACLMQNLDAIRRAFAMTARDRIISWLPSYHDMGLIGAIFAPLFVGATLVCMAPAHFLQRPRRWLHAVSRHRGTITGGPNFAYDLCVRKIPPEQRTQLDLSSLQVAFVGAEPVRAATLSEFADAFAPSGFDQRAFFPCYGLAEATLYVTGMSRGSGFQARSFDKAAREQARAVPAADDALHSLSLVSCGRPVAGYEVLVVDGETRAPLEEQRVGEIWVRGPSVASGYWQRPHDATFDGELSTAAGDTQRYLRTGDLGFLCEGDLYICGRSKDVIVVRGRKHFPEDIEATVAACHPKIRFGGCVAFGLAGPGDAPERVVVAIEVARPISEPAQLRSLLQAVERAVIAMHQIHVHEVVILGPGGIPKTSSGKVQRSACRQAFVSGELGELVRGSQMSAAIA